VEGVWGVDGDGSVLEFGRLKIERRCVGVGGCGLSYRRLR